MSTPKKILKLPLRVSLAILLFGTISKISEWPFAAEIMLIGFSAIGFLYVFRFLKKTEKKFIDYVKLILVIFWTANGIFKILSLPFTLFFQIIIALSFIIWFVMEGTAYFLDEERRAKNSTAQILWNCALVIGTLGVIAGSLLRLIDWDYSVHILSLGITMIAAYILKDVFIPESGDDSNNEEFQL